MYGVVFGSLVGSQLHGFHTLRDLDMESIKEEAKTRWLRSNEIYAILCNYNYFDIAAKPLHLPGSGTIVLYNRKMLRNFRKDGHNWKKKSDGKTIKEAHERLKVGDDERIHVYYAHCEDNPTFVRRIYWLLDKALEHIVLVHYREVQERQGPIALTVASNSSPISVRSSSFDGEDAFHPVTDLDNSLTHQNLKMKLHELNTLEWEDLIMTNHPVDSTPKFENISSVSQQPQATLHDSGTYPSSHDISAEVSSFKLLSGENMIDEGLQSQDSFGKWINNVISDSPNLVDDPGLGTSPSVNQPSVSPPTSHSTASEPEPIFNITDISTTWAYSTEETKILVTGIFQDNYLELAKSNLFCFCGDVCVTANLVQVGVYRCFLPPHSPGAVNLYMSWDGQKPISQVLGFEYRTKQLQQSVATKEDLSKREELQLQTRLARLLLSTSWSLEAGSGKVSSSSLHQAKKFDKNTSQITKSWDNLLKSIRQNDIPFDNAKDVLYDIILKNRLKGWIMEKVIGGVKTANYDEEGQGVIHLCAILGYRWAVQLFSLSGLSLDFRDKHGWTALHWAAYHGREEMVAALLSAGARPNLVTDPTSENPGGCTAADLAAKQGYDGIAAYLSEMALAAQFRDMKIAGNISGSLQLTTSDTSNREIANEDDVNLKDTLEAYRSVVEAASRIQVAFREHALKQQANNARFTSSEDEARSVVAAMKIQHAFRHHERRKRMKAAARIQCSFRTWRIRKEFLNQRRQAIKIQAAFRAYQTRKQYKKIVWSVGVIEKAILRWRLKRKGFRGLQTDATLQTTGTDTDTGPDGDVEEFYKASQIQAEERLERSVVTVQALFRSKQAQQEYRRMKQAHQQASLDREFFLGSSIQAWRP